MAGRDLHQPPPSGISWEWRALKSSAALSAPFAELGKSYITPYDGVLLQTQHVREKEIWAPGLKFDSDPIQHLDLDLDPNLTRLDPKSK
ncbi:hypothetical protein C2S53_008954 [Perilla frutescens var. hirtella]|uniref:Uncharacterized protein n=1 Tax=Perilla frutescens var. hirtella TaxID=608512 RepID=A0AAD4JGY7_PERFH|nr:hypothetical protein C2S53_008954 [Perilla frutescens var. hirtella]